MSHRVAHLDDVERVPVDGGEEFSLSWLPVRGTLGIRAFGTNAYVADTAGVHVVEPHTEGSGHEELYFVARGHARFILGGESVDAPAGTYVFLPDGSVHREAIAVEDGTTVLSFGAPVGRPYEVSAWEWAFRAGALRYSSPAQARAILADGLQAQPGAGSLHYEVACLDALAGNADAALAALAQAIRLRPETAEWAREDEDFAGLRADARFAELVAQRIDR